MIVPQRAQTSAPPPVSTMLFHAHSGLRYLVLLAGVIALVMLARGLSGTRPFDRGARVAGAVFMGLLDLQVLLGLLTAMVRPWQPSYAGHVAMMVIAVATAHILRVRAMRAPDDRARYKTALLAVLIPLVLIVAGIAAIGRRIV